MDDVGAVTSRAMRQRLLRTVRGVACYHLQSLQVDHGVQIPLQYVAPMLYILSVIPYVSCNDLVILNVVIPFSKPFKSPGNGTALSIK